MEQFMKLMKDGRRMFTDEDDKVMMRLIQTTHAYDGQVVEVEPLLQLIKEILRPSSSPTTVIVQDRPTNHVGYAMESLKKKTSTATFEALADTIHKISREISCKCNGGGDNTHLTMSAMINMLSSYPWDAKVVLVLAAFAVTYGGFLLGTNKWNPPETLSLLIEAMVNMAECVTKCIVNFSKLPRQNSLDQSVIHFSVYWTVRSVVACSPQFFGLIGLGYEYTLSRSEDQELYKLTKKLNLSYFELEEQLRRCSQYIAEMKLFEEYQVLVQLFQTTHTDNIEILTALIIEQLFQTSTKQRFGVDVLRGKNVLLLITELNVFQEEIGLLFEMYRKSIDQQTKQESQIEVVCITMGDSTEAKREDFELQLSKMPWYWVHHDRADAVFKYIKEVWHFNKKPILVVLNPLGEVVSPDAFPKIKIWGKLDLSITITREEDLWSEATWGLDLLLESIHKYEQMSLWANTITNRVKENPYICLYGGEDLDWIRKFTKTARNVAADAHIKFEMVYMGMRDQTERLQNTISVVTKENLSSCWPEADMSNFWVRLESMWHSKMQKKSHHHNKDEMFKEIQTMLTFGGSEQGWAMICEGSTIKVKAKGDIMLNCFEQYSSWKESAQVNFMEAVNGYLIKSQENISRHCNRIILSGTVASISEDMFCKDCECSLEKFVMYRCCKD